MDHSIAYLMEFTSDPFEIRTVESKFSYQKKMEALARSENLMHQNEDQHLTSYYKKLGAIIKDYSEVVLFGPTDAKVELSGILSEDKGFSNIKIEIKETDKMTTNQKDAFVKNYFSKA
jgi:hypothetical protein